jgi:hypothetical protein
MRKNLNSTGLSRDLGDRLPDRRPTEEVEESEVEIVESRILPNQIREGIKNT